jgi:simple sugar transport system ATP-binding protein
MVGANGAGKSTLIKALCGAHAEYEGTIEIEGAPVHFRGPRDARRHGIEAVHQHIDEGVVPGLSVAENLTLDLLASGDEGFLFSQRRGRREAVKIAERLGLRLTQAELRDDVRRLSVSRRQLLVLARALSRSPRVLILDEPTSALSAAEAERLFEVVRKLVAERVAVLYVSHRLGEVDALADRVAVLRDGRLRAVFQRPFERRAVVEAMLGEAVAELEHREQSGEREVLRLEAVQLTPRWPPIDLTFRSGQVTGVIGLIGAGKTELAEGLFGLRRPAAGRLLLEGRPYRPHHPSDAVSAGCYLVPEDRSVQALVPGWSVRANLSLPFLGAVDRFGLVRVREERRRAQRLIGLLRVVCTGPEAEIGSLSGGNQQKVAVGRWLGGEPRVLVLDEPFRGVDIGARRDISAKLRELAARTAVIVLTADPDELFEVADRVLVLAAGTVALDEPISRVSRAAMVSAMTKAA